LAQFERAEEERIAKLRGQGWMPPEAKTIRKTR
jgi:hypothetical protein